MSAAPALYRRLELPAEALRLLAYEDPAHFPVLLDSSATGPLGRYSILGACPQGVLWLDRDGQLHSEGLGRIDARQGFSGALEALYRREGAGAGAGAGAAGGEDAGADADAGAGAGASLRTAAAGEAAAGAGPFRGGWMLFLSYELAGEFEPQLRLPRPAGSGLAQDDAPMALALRIPAAITYDHQNGAAWLVAEPDQHALLERLAERVARLPPAGAALAALQRLALPPLHLAEEPPERYQRSVERALEHIRAGDIYQANLARCWRGEFAPPAGSG